jgi:hypothetical protein
MKKGKKALILDLDGLGINENICHAIDIRAIKTMDQCI